jgi:siroheme synthase-like protein
VIFGTVTINKKILNRLPESLQHKESEGNELFPIFVNLLDKRLLIIGGGQIGLEKVQTLLSHAPKSKITLIAGFIRKEIYLLKLNHPQIQLMEKIYEPDDLIHGDLILVAANDIALGERIKKDLVGTGKLLNVADKPSLCDFYLGAVVKKGNLKIAISTNGKSPTMAKRLKENLNELIPDSLDEILNQMSLLRKGLGGSFEEKIQKLNSITKVLATGKGQKKPYWVIWLCLGLALIFLGWSLSLIPLSGILKGPVKIFTQMDSIVYWMFLVGFCAQMVNGALGMGYGVITTLILLFMGINLPAISGSIHTAELFSSGAGALSHYHLKNFNKKLFKSLILPGIAGGVFGALILSGFGDRYAYIIRPVWGIYTLYLGLRILINAFKLEFKKGKIHHLGWLALGGGFLDSFGGGGWGPLVTGTLIAHGKTPKYVIGTASITKFFVTLASALTFFSLLGLSHLPIILGLTAGGLLAGPIAPILSGKMPKKYLFLAVGTVVILSSIRVLLGAFHIL